MAAETDKQVTYVAAQQNTSIIGSNSVDYGSQNSNEKKGKGK